MPAEDLGNAERYWENIRLNMFPDQHTEGVSDSRRAFLMGNALVTGIVEKIGIVLLHNMDAIK